jgi:hypothetical protein
MAARLAIKTRKYVTPALQHTFLWFCIRECSALFAPKGTSKPMAPSDFAGLARLEMAGCSSTTHVTSQHHTSFVESKIFFTKRLFQAVRTPDRRHSRHRPARTASTGTIWSQLMANAVLML